MTQVHRIPHFRTPTSSEVFMKLAKHLAFIILLSLFSAFSLGSEAHAEEGRLLRFPDVYRDQVVFVYAGDLWLASTQGGPARRLTSDPGLELFPKFSPDGKHIAFTAEYDGNRDVYVIPAQGGEPKRLTYSQDMSPSPPDRQGFNNMTLGWTRDGQRVLYRSRQTSFNSWVGSLMTVGINGGTSEPLPVPRGGYATFSPDGTKIAYNRLFREFRTWKRYRGGQADDVWLYDLKSGSLENVTNNPAQDNFPMWSGDKIYFLSDRDQFANLFIHNLQTKQTKKLTNYSEYDVKYPSLGVGAIAYENGGFIYLLDLDSETPRKLNIEVNDDRRWTRTELVNPKDLIRNFELSPDGKRALFEARGEIFTVPAEKGDTRNLTNTSGAHEKNPVWSPDGKFIAYLSDVSGEEEFYLIAQDGSAPPIRLTTNGAMLRFGAVWSPDSRKLAFADKSHTLYWLDAETKKITRVDAAPHGDISTYNWSPDSQWIAYDHPEENGFSSVYLYSLAQNKTYPVTTDLTDSNSPTFDPSGKYLYFISNRDLNASVGNFEYNYSYQKTARIFAVTLQAETPSPLAPESDEVSVGNADKPQEGKKSDFRIDVSGIQNRIVGLTMPPGAYVAPRAAKNKIFYLSLPTFQLTGGATERTTLRVYELDKRKESEIGPADAYEMSFNGEKLIVRTGANYAIIDAKAGVKPGDGVALNLSNLKMRLDRKAEWKQIFDEAWRLERDFFYAPNMHGVDWPAIKRRYEILLPHVSHRFDLNYLLGEMIAELHVGHAYVNGGDLPRPSKQVRFGLLGADFEMVNGYYRLKTILEGENWREDRRSPLTEPGVVVKTGDYVVAIDGEELRAPKNPFALLEGKNGTTVTLKINSQPSLAGAREVKVRTIESETQLRYFNYVERNRRYVEQKTNGRIGYVHIPNMGGDGLNEFVKYYYPQVRKEGLIVDDRYNGGGNVSRLIIERLRRVLGAMSAQRDTGPTTYPDAVFTGPMVCLLNELSASDGDIFPFMFKQYKLGKTIGKRSWGGVIGIRGGFPFVDGGSVTRPEFGFYSVNGEWIIENHGVDPDITIDNPPLDEFNGRDAQLDRAIEEVLAETKIKPSALPKRPADPIR
jgi:tricorn protease